MNRVEVVPLEWVHREFPVRQERAQTPFGNYTVTEGGNTLSDLPWWEGFGRSGTAKTFEEAKAGALDDFRRSGLACIRPMPESGEPRFKIREIGEIECKGVDGKPEHIHGLVLEALSDDDVRAVGHLLLETVTVSDARLP